jgi:uncharacterized RDD family membrane protein YckC/predicted RNA-binding Zn-ribbon protein involved in translation (DUF1610 family)
MSSDFAAERLAYIVLEVFFPGVSLMPISVKCTDCGKALQAPDALAGKKAKCPDCGAIVPIPAAFMDAEAMDEPPPLPEKSLSSATAKPKPQPADDDDMFHDPAEDEVDAPTAGGRKPCPMCGEMIAASAAKCRFCGEIFDARVRRGGRRSGGAVDYAGFWTRFIAAFVDGIVVIIIAVAIGFIVGMILGPLFAAGGGNVRNNQAFFRLVGNVIGILTGWLYFALQESSEKQATVGKKMMGILVTDLDGNRISFGRASGRHFGKILSGCLLLIGYIMAGLTEKKQALHDMMAGTLVVRN